MTTEKDDDEEPMDFLQSMMGDHHCSDAVGGDDDGNAEDHTTTSTTTKPPETTYTSKKPLWWKKLSGKPSKGQKRAMTAMASWRLPKVPWGECLDWNAVFPQQFHPVLSKEDENNNSTATATDTTSKDIWLEIGFGTGDNLLANAQQHPHRLFVGAEVHNPGIGKACQRMLQALQNDRYWTDYVEYSEETANRPTPTTTNIDQGIDHGEAEGTIQGLDNGEAENYACNPPKIPEQQGFTPFNSSTLYSNVRIYGGDGVKLLPYIPTHSLAAVLVTFPDPFPKDGQMQFRVLQQHTLLEIHRILRPGDGRLYLATDHTGHHAWCHATVDQVNNNHEDKRETKTEADQQQPKKLFDAIEVTDRTDWLPVISKYEQKGWNEGRRTHLSCWEVVKDSEC